MTPSRAAIGAEYRAAIARAVDAGLVTAGSPGHRWALAHVPYREVAATVTLAGIAGRVARPAELVPGIVGGAG